MAGQSDTLKTTPEQRPKVPGGVTGKGWVPGQSGNPGGRPKGLARMVRERLQEGQKLVDLYYRMAYGGTFRMRVLVQDEKGGLVERDLTIRPKIQDRKVAADWLAERGWGKVKDVIQVEGEETKLPIAMVLMREMRDPLAPDAPQEAQKPRPALPGPQAEVGFEMADFEDVPPKEKR